MTIENENVPAGATNTNEDNEQILKTNSDADCISALLAEADQILMEDAQHLLDNLIF